MASRDQQYHDNLFDSTSARSQPRASSQAPVLFGLPNLQKVEPQERRPLTPPPAVASQFGAVSQASAQTQSSVASASMTSSNSASIKAATQTTSATPTTPQVSASSPSYQAVPETIKQEQKVALKPFLGGWGNRMIVLSALIVIVLYGWKMMPDLRRNVANEALEKEGIAESNLESEVELPIAFNAAEANQETATKPTTEEVPRVAQAPATPPFNIISGRSNEASPPSTQISLETPSAQRSTNTQSGTREENSSFKLDGDTESFNLGSGTDSRNGADDAWMNPPKLSQDSSNASDLDVPTFVNNQGSQPQADQSFVMQDTSSSQPPQNTPSITETEFANLSIEELYAARNRMMAERSIRNGVANSATPQFQTASTQANLQRTPLQGQAYPANTSTPNRVVVPNSGQVGPALRPYQPIGTPQVPSNPPTGYGMPVQNYPLQNGSTNFPVGPQLQPATNGTPFQQGSNAPLQFAPPQNGPMQNGPMQNGPMQFAPPQNGPMQNGLGQNVPPASPANGVPNSYQNRLNPNAMLPSGAAGSGVNPTATAPKVVLPPYTPVGFDPSIANGPTAPTPMPNRQ